MKKQFVRGGYLFATLMILMFATTACNENSSNLDLNEDNNVKTAEQPAIPASVLETDTIASCVTDCLNSLPTEDLSDAEINHLQYMREEEFLARDVYSYFKELYTVPVFKNISKAEQFHTSVIKVLLDKYQLADPGAEHVYGEFENETLQDLYNQLTLSGSNSLVDALTVGATIEDLDIFDLEECLLETDNEDITLVFNNLMKGSRNHLRAFTKHLSFQDTDYQPQYISQEEFDEIVGSKWEVGNGICCYCSEK
jgi:hypothetical protein